MSTDTSKTIVLAAIVQAAKQVQNIARNNTTDEMALKRSIESLFMFEADSVEDIFVNDDKRLFDLRIGLQQVVQMLNVNSTDQVDRECWRYSLLLLQLAKKLKDDAARSRRLGQLLHSFHSQHQVYNNEVEYFESLANVYQQVVSKMSPQIMIYGENGYLQQPNNPEKVRCLLLAGVRASFLWWQLGGQRWSLLLPSVRKNYGREAQRILANL